MAAGDERKVVTVLFADLVDSTVIAESIDPERLRSLLATYFRAMSEVLETWGASVEKYIGDAIVAIFGVPVVHEDDAERAIRAGLAMLHRLGSLNDELEPKHGVRLTVRIGINTGDVIVPADDRGGEFIVADAVNTAARLQTAAPGNSILAGPRTRDAARSGIEFGEPIELVLKGKSEPLRAWPVVRPRSEPERGIPGLRGPMVGRDTELASLRALLGEAIERAEPRLALIYGPPGIGKSRLVTELTALGDGGPTAPRVVRGRSLAPGQGGTYGALGEILRAVAGSDLDVASASSIAALRDGVSDPLRALGLDESELERTVVALGLTAGLDLSDRAGYLSPERAGQELQLAWPRLASALAKERPLILVLEDLHWAAEPLLEVVSAIVGRSAGRVLVVATARPELAERHPGFLAARDDTASITLRPLSDAAAAALIDGLLEVAELPAELRSEIVSRAEGNPFFVEELLRRLIDEGAIVAEGHAWRATSAATKVVLPDSIQGLLGARIDDLSPIAKVALREAAIVGRAFWLPAVAEQLGGPDAAVAAVHELEGRAFVVARPTSSVPGLVEYQFRHALIRDVAYASVAKARRGRAHAAAAAWLEGIAGAHVARFAETVADHYRAALLGDDADLAWLDDAAGHEVIRARAVPALLQGGDVTRRVGAPRRAAELHEAALALAVSSAERLAATEALADDLQYDYRPLEAVEHYRSLLDAFRAAGRDRDVSRITLKLAQTVVYRSASDTSAIPVSEIDAHIDEALTVDADPSIRGSLLALSGELSLLYRADGHEDPRSAVERRAALSQATAIAEELGDIELATAIEQTSINLAYFGDDWAGAREHTERLLRLESRTDDAAQKLSILLAGALGIADLDGRVVAAHELVRRAINLTATSHHYRLHVTAHYLSISYRAGAWREAEAILQEHLREARIEGISCPVVRAGVAMAGTIAGWQRRRSIGTDAIELIESKFGSDSFTSGAPVRLLEANGLPDRARALGVDAFERLQRPFSDDAIWPTLDVAVTLADWPLVERLVEMARATADGIAPHGPAADRAEGVLLGTRGDGAAARVRLDAALDGFTRLEMPFEVLVTARHLAAVPGLDATTREALGARAAGIEVDLGFALEGARAGG